MCPPKYTDYKIVIVNSNDANTIIQEFEKQVTKYLHDGYVPTGSPTYSFENGSHQCMQAVCLQNPDHPSNGIYC